jgi:streptogramin lyase
MVASMNFPRKIILLAALLLVSVSVYATSTHIYAASNDYYVLRIDTATNTNDLNIVTAQPITAVAIDGNDNAWALAQNATSYLYRIDAAGTIVATITVGAWATDLAIDNNHNVFVETGASVQQIDMVSNTIVNTISFGGSGDCKIVIDKNQNLWCGQSSDERVKRVDLTTGTVVASIVTGAGAGNMDVALDSNQNVWFGEYYNNKIQRINPLNNTIVQTINSSSNLNHIIVDLNNDIWTTQDGTIVVKYTSAGVQKASFSSTCIGTADNIDVDSNNSIWVMCDSSGDSTLVKIDPVAEAVTETLYLAMAQSFDDFTGFSFRNYTYHAPPAPPAPKPVDLNTDGIVLTANSAFTGLAGFTSGLVGESIGIGQILGAIVVLIVVALLAALVAKGARGARGVV